MVNTLNKPEEVEFNGKTYRLMGARKYYLSSSAKNEERRHAKGLHVAIWEFYHHQKVPTECCIHHKDGNPFNNDINNLECVNKSEHFSKHSLNNWKNPEFRKLGVISLNNIRNKASEWHKSPEGLKWHQKNKENYSKPVDMFDTNGNKLNSFASLIDASRETGISYSGIAKCAKGDLKTSGGFVWKYSKN